MILRPSDTVALILPAAELPEADAALLKEAAHVLEGWGLRVAMHLERRRHFYLAGTDAVRARHLHAVLADPSVRAIFAARGGYGCLRLLSHLDPKLKPGEKFLVGFSDVTALHLAQARLWPRLRAVHGPNVASHHFLGPEKEAERNRAALHGALFDPAYQVEEPVTFIREGRAEGPLVGGCLSLVAAMLGSGFVPRTRERILFLEDVREAPYRIDRMLVQLRNAGLFDHVAGVVFGEMHDCADGINDIPAVIADVLAGSSYPIAFGLPAGHGALNLALPLGRRAVLDSTNRQFLMKEGTRISPINA